MSSGLVTSGLRRETELCLMWLGGGLLLIVLWGMLIAGLDKSSLRCRFRAPLLLLAVYDKESAVLWTLAYLILLGDIRRIVAEIAAPSTFDPLLLVAPAVTVVLVVPLLFGLRLREPLSKAVLALLVVMGLEVVESQAGRPEHWFVGRVFLHHSGDVVLDRPKSGISRAGGDKLFTGWCFRWASAPGSSGLCQNFIGFLPYQQAWIATVGRVYTSLYVGSSVRAFGFSVSAAEYATLLEYSIALVVAAYFASRRLWIGCCADSRDCSPSLRRQGTDDQACGCALHPVGCAKGKKLNVAKLLGMARPGEHIACQVFLSLLDILASPTVAGQPGAAAKDALAHQLGGLAHPFDERYSSAGLHSNMITTGFLEGIKNPLGHGLGSTTFAAQKFGTDNSGGSSELDFSDMFISLGLVGGLLYLGVSSSEYAQHFDMFGKPK